MTNWAGPGPIGQSQALMGHHVSHERGGADEMVGLFDEIDETNAVITSAFFTAFLTLGTQSTDISALQAAVAALGKQIVQVQLAQASNVTVGTSLVDIVTKAVTVGAGGVFVLGQCGVFEAKSASDDYNHTFALKRGTTIIGMQTDNHGFGTAVQTARSQSTPWSYEVPGAGTYTYRVTAGITNHSTTSALANAQILIVELSP